MSRENHVIMDIQVYAWNYVANRFADLKVSSDTYVTRKLGDDACGDFVKLTALHDAEPVEIEVPIEMVPALIAAIETVASFIRRHPRLVHTNPVPEP